MTTDKHGPDRSSAYRHKSPEKSDGVGEVSAVPRAKNKAEGSGGTSIRGICRYLKVSVWESDDLYALPPQGQSRLVYLYLLTGPHTLGLHVPGLYSIGQQALRERLGISAQQFAQAMATLRAAVGLKTDFSRCLLWLPSALEQMGPPANPNIVRSYCRGLQLAPKSPLRDEAIQAYAPFLASLGQNLLEPFADCFPEVCQTLQKPFRKEREREREKEKEKEKATDRRAKPLAFAKAHSGLQGPSRAAISSSVEPQKPDFKAGLMHVGEFLQSLN